MIQQNFRNENAHKKRKGEAVYEIGLDGWVMTVTGIEGIGLSGERYPILEPTGIIQVEKKSRTQVRRKRKNMKNELRDHSEPFNFYLVNKRTLALSFLKSKIVGTLVFPFNISLSDEAHERARQGKPVCFRRIETEIEEGRARSLWIIHASTQGMTRLWCMPKNRKTWKEFYYFQPVECGELIGIHGDELFPVETFSMFRISNFYDS